MSIDERLEALTTNLEIISGMVKDSLERSRHFEALVIAHEQDSQRLRRAVIAALQAWAKEDGNPNE